MQLNLQHRGLSISELAPYLHETLGETLTLSTGKKIGYLEFGDPSGVPLFYFHGSLSTRIEAGILAESAVKYGIRLIALDRPGIGLSDSRKKFSFVDWPMIVKEVADKLGIDRFSVCGTSGGGAFSCACGAIKNISSRIDAIVIIAGMIPTISSEKEHQLTSQRILFFISRHASILGRAILHLMTTKIKNAMKNDLKGLIESVDEKDIVLEKSIMGNVLYQSIISSQLQGHAGNVRDLGLYTGSLGFNLEDIEVPVLVFTGLKDRSVPSVIANRVAQQVQYGKLITYNDAGHITIFKYTDDICQQIKLFIDCSVDKHPVMYNQ